MEKIEVFYRNIGQIGLTGNTPDTQAMDNGHGLDYHHKYLLYTDKDGNQFAVSGWDQGGQLVHTNNVYDSDYPDHPDNENTHNLIMVEGKLTPNSLPKTAQQQYSELITTGSDLSAQWQTITQTYQNIHDGNYEYNALVQNSNSAADAALRAAGLPEPQMDGITGYWAPGSDNEINHESIEDKIKNFYEDGKGAIQDTGNTLYDLLFGKEAHGADITLEQFKNRIATIEQEALANNPIDQFTFDTADQAYDNWQNSNIFSLNAQGELVVNEPSNLFTDIGDLFDAEDAILQEFEEGWIGQVELEAFQDYVLDFSLQDYVLDFSLEEFDYNFEPIGAFYDSQSAAYDNAESIASHTGVLLDLNNQAVNIEQLHALDFNGDGQLSHTESSSLQLWQDTNEDGHLNSGELVSLNTLSTPIQQADYGFYTRGNGHLAISQPNQAMHTTEPAVPNSHYRSLRDSDNTYIVNTPSQFALIEWTTSMIKINSNHQHYLIGTDGDDNFDANYYANETYFDLTLLTHFLAGDGNDLMGGSERSDHLWGGTGNDQLLGYAGNDKIYGEQGNDRIFAGVGNDTVHGGTGDDVIISFTAGNDAKQTLEAGETDNDQLYGGTGNDALYGGLGDDTLDGGTGSDALLGGKGDDRLWGGSGNDEFQGNQGNDELMGGTGEDRLFGQTGDDKLWGGAGDDLLLGFSKPEKGRVDGEDVLVYGFPKRNELDYMQGDAILRQELAA